MIYVFRPEFFACLFYPNENVENNVLLYYERLTHYRQERRILR
jgi:hypothetical protein